MHMKTNKIIKSLHTLTDASKWNGVLDDEAKEAAHILCSFYGVEEEEQLLRKVYKCPVKSATVMLEIFKEKGVHLVFPALYQLVKIYATLPASTAIVERSFSKLKLVKSRLRSLCGQERLSDLLLLGIEGDIPIDKEEVINIFEQMVPNRRLEM